MYLVDSDVLIDAKNRHYGFDIVPGFWDWLSAQHLAGKIFIVQRVYDELVGGADELSTWVKAQPASFRLAPGPADSASLSRVSQWATSVGYKPAAVSEFLRVGDYFNVVQALTLSYVVVTQEKREPQSRKKIKIPDACDAVGVRWMTPFEMLRAEGAQFA